MTDFDEEPRNHAKPKTKQKNKRLIIGEIGDRADKSGLAVPLDGEVEL